jgi:non-heme chloroperoxidase
VSSITTKDGAEIYYKGWGTGPTVLFSHGWPLNADVWDDQMTFMASRGFRCVAFDRRGHGRSSQPWEGNNYDAFAEDLAALIGALGLKATTLVGHSAGAGDIARYIGRHGTARVSATVMVSAIPPLMLKTPANPGGVPREVFDGIRAGVAGNRAQFYRDLGNGPFFGANRPGSNVSQGVKDAFWLWSMQVGLRASYEGIKAFSETDFTLDLKRFDVPTLIIHGEDDQNVPDPEYSAALIEIDQESCIEGLSRGAAWADGHPQGQVQRRPSGVPQERELTSKKDPITRQSSKRN